ncbi:MAG: succinate-semialdehyde dehydrogenase/glutarate-semialdehyde dehydrogenase [Bacteroidia bacterium]|jgi:succinate-semialdehyde dehydrogenase/glutarate-semialdehyde dehydrogenase
MMNFKSVNPATNQVVGTYQEETETVLLKKLDLAQEVFTSWRKSDLAHRCELLKKAGQILRDNVEEYAQMITAEMGKPIAESRGEVNKCAWVCDYYAENAADFLQDEIIVTDAYKSYVAHQPMGCVFAIMPWNFPFWQVFRFAAPTLTAGNTGMLKHAPNVFGCALLIEDVFTKAGYPKGVFQNIIVHHNQTETIIGHSAIKAVTLTGSEGAGIAVAEIAGRNLKKSLLELGGNNAFIVLKDANLDQAVRTAVVARMLNCGQSCIAAKRFILVDEIYDDFVARFTDAVREMKMGDPLAQDTKLGPMARIDLATQLQAQVTRSIEIGAQLLLGGKQDECFHEATILGNVQPGMPAFDEETFGPLAAMIRVQSAEEAFKLAEQSRFGLGCTVCTTDLDYAMSMASEISDGAFFVNELVKSDPRLPFGGTKKSGYGRELSKDGMMEFVNRQAVYVKK